LILTLIPEFVTALSSKNPRRLQLVARHDRSTSKKKPAVRDGSLAAPDSRGDMKQTSPSRFGIFWGLMLIVGCGAPGDPRAEDLGVATEAFQVTNNGGRVLANVQINAVFWGGNVDSTVSSQIPAFYAAVTNSPYMDRLSEYGTPTGQAIDRGSVTQIATINPVHTTTTVSDLDIQAELGTQIDQGHLSPPNANSLYMVHLPPTVTVIPATGSMISGTSCVSYCAYHNSFGHDGQAVTYAVLPDIGPNCASFCQTTPTKFGNQTFAATHEMTEAITDPDFMQGWYSNNWVYNDNGGEIADPCLQQGAKPLPGTGYTVTQTFSNMANRCGVEGPRGVIYTPGDFDGDGLTDLIVTTAIGSYWYFSNGDGNWNTSIYNRSDLTLGTVAFTPGDFDGDGKTDLIITTANGSFWYYSNWTKSGTTRSGGWNTQYYRTDLPTGVATYTPGDFDGDGKTDVIITTPNGSWWYFSTGRGTFNNGWTDPSLQLNAVAFTPADIDGDGKTDLIITTPSGSIFYFSQFTLGSGMFQPFYWGGPAWALGKVMFTPGNFSGSPNHRSDLIITTFDASRWWFSQFTNGAGFFSFPYTRTDLPLGTVQYTTANFDGDPKGTTDMLITHLSGSYWYMSNGDGSWYYPATWSPTLGNVVYTPGKFFNPNSFSGAVPNAANVILTTSNGSNWYYLEAPATAGSWGWGYVNGDLTL
jgi:hypothetical protein